MQIIFCRHADCGKPYESHAGKHPPICPSCEKVAAWSVEEGTNIIAVAPFWNLSAEDRIFLKVQRIKLDGPSDPTIEADDPA